MKNFSKVTALLTFPLVFLFSMVVFGQVNPCPPVDVQVINDAAQQQEWWMVLLDALLQLVAPFAIAILSTLASIAIRKWGKKLDVDTQDRLIGITDNLIASGVSFAEEQGRKALKGGEDQTDGARKLQHAVDYIQEQLDESQLPQIGTEKLQRLIEARLHAERTRPDGRIPSEENVKPGLPSLPSQEGSEDPSDKNEETEDNITG